MLQYAQSAPEGLFPRSCWGGEAKGTNFCFGWLPKLGADERHRVAAPRSQLRVLCLGSPSPASQRHTRTHPAVLEPSHQLFRGLAGAPASSFPFPQRKPRSAFLTPEVGRGVPVALFPVTCISPCSIQGSAANWPRAVIVFICVVITDTSLVCVSLPLSWALFAVALPKAVGPC